MTNMKAAITTLFDRYAALTNQALAGKADMDAVGALYDDAFIGAAPAGVMVGKNDAAFKKTLAAGFDRYRQIGTQRMDVRGVHVEPIDPLHALARVEWHAVYDVDGEEKTVDFTNAYLVRMADDEPKVFGWITGDEEALLREQGIVD